MNSTQRRQVRRMLQAAGLGWLLRVPAPVPPKQVGWWRRIPRWAWAILAALSILVSLLQSYPWLSVHEGTVLDADNPYSEMWNVANGGYVAITNLSADCSIDGAVLTGDNKIEMRSTFPDFADVLAHDGYATIPCFRMIQLNGRWKVTEANRLSVHISYAFLYLNWRPLRRSQKFRFHAVAAKDGSYHWERLS